MSASTYRRASGFAGHFLRPYVVCTVGQLSSVVTNDQRRVTQWLDATPHATFSLISNVVSAGSPMLNLNVDGYPALEMPKQSGNSGLHFADAFAENPAGETFVFYVRLKLSDVLYLASTAFSYAQLGVAGITLSSTYGAGGGGTVSAALSASSWHSVVISQNSTTGFVLLDGVAYPIARSALLIFYYQVLYLFASGSCYVRYLAAYQRATTSAEAGKLHQQLLASFPAIAVAPRFATPQIAALSPPQSETQQYFTLTLDAGHVVQDYGVSYDSGDTFVPLTSAALAGNTIQVPLPAAFYFPGEVAVKLLSTLARPESLLATHAGVLGFVNYLYDSYFAQGITYWSVQDVAIASNAATWQKDGGSLFQAIPGHTLRAGYQYKIQVTGTGSFHINKNEDYYGGQPNTDFTLTNGQTLEFNVGYGDVAHGMYLTLTGTAGSVLTRVVWTIQ